jgi:hypothetical protein
MDCSYRSISSLLLEDGNLAGCIALGVGTFDHAFQRFVVLLRVGVEIFDFEEANFEYIFVQSELALDVGHN